MKGMQIDHINRNKLDNRRVNLRFVTPQQNLLNRVRTGSYFHKVSKKWVSQHASHYLGMFPSKEEADANTNRYREIKFRKLSK